MAAQTIYMMNGRGADPAILKGLLAAGCDVRDTHSVAETLNSLRKAGTRSGAKGVMLVAEVQAGAIPLLTLLRETGATLPPTLLFDQEGNSIQSAIKALTFGVQDYVLASEPAIQRELRARVLAERIQSNEPVAANKLVFPREPVADPLATESADARGDFQWDPEAKVIYIQDKYIRLSPVEGRVFDLLLSRRNRTVTMEELLSHGLERGNGSVEEGIKLLRPHMMRLRNKLERHPRLAHRVINVRGNGYMFI
ncbi:MAG: winged helix-turn-helix domain-containing protein [Chloroflexi bacterium]|nr:winged helix-turn-helix domain-containing protein [Chloroflexota bacterium]MCL5275142.1 winged helix-turn-helix domain-containing protein [Chloroflexota bacterium]